MKVINNLTIGSRLAFVFGIIILLLAGFGIYTYQKINDTEAIARNIAENRIPDLTDLAAISAERMALRAQTVSVPGIPYGMLGRPELEAIKQQREASWEVIANALASFQSRPRGNQTGRDMTAELVGAWEEDVTEAYAELRRLLDALLAAPDAQTYANLQQDYSYAVIDMLPASERLNDAVQALWTNNTTNTAKRAMEAVAAMNSLLTTTLILIAVILLVCVVSGAVVTKSISTPVKRLLTVLETIGKGDMTVAVPADIVARKDEAGQLGQALETTTTAVRDTIGRLVKGISTLAAASTELLAIVDQNLAGAESLKERSRTVASAAEEMNANTVSVAAGMEQATNNLSSVASATEEMTATIGEIAGNTERARRTTTEAGNKVDEFSLLMKELGAAAEEIGKVTDTINKISEQTNLLALNATIEAARAGSAGKGFAVVANEIKELAKQTAKATEEIQSRISTIQDTTGSAVEDVGSIVKVMREVNDIVTSIAAAIEEQSSVTRDVAGNIAEANRGVQESARRTGETATASQSVAQDIAEVNQTALQMSDANEQTANSARELSQLAEELSAAIQRFKV
jgi:methyl-accepting chemotaxis protein